MQKGGCLAKVGNNKRWLLSFPNTSMSNAILIRKWASSRDKRDMESNSHMKETTRKKNDVLIN